MKNVLELDPESRQIVYFLLKSYVTVGSRGFILLIYLGLDNFRNTLCHIVGILFYIVSSIITVNSRAVLT